MDYRKTTHTWMIARPSVWLAGGALCLGCSAAPQSELILSSMGGALNTAGSVGMMGTNGGAGAAQAGASGMEARGGAGAPAGGGSGGTLGEAGAASAGSAGEPAAGAGGQGQGGEMMGGAGGLGEQGGQGGEGGASPVTNPSSCLPAFEEVCKPTINFENQDPDNSGNFDAVIQDVEAELQDAICTMCSILYRSPEDLPRTHETINFVIDDHDGVAYAGGNSIHLSTGHIQNYGDPESAYVEFKGVMVHESAHLYQVNGGNSDGALIEGIADFVRVRAGYYGPGRCGGGDSWDGAYTTSGCFFSWLAGSCEYHEQQHPQSDADIGYRLNLIMSQGKAAIQQEIEDTFGVGVQDLWDTYKSEY